jgi:phosphoribosylanthranilate isomerase
LDEQLLTFSAVFVDTGKKQLRMINGIRFKICGITSLVDAEAADACGADYLGFNLHPKSPRYLLLDAFKAMLPLLPDSRKKVAVVVEPNVEDLSLLIESGFDLVQLHFPIETPLFQIALWSDAIPKDKIWFVPRVPPGTVMDPAFFSLASTILFDSYNPGVFGGTGETSDWSEFVSLKDKYTRLTWVLAGGLNPENIGQAIATTDAKIVDVNSGIEVSPGIKDYAKMKAFVLALHKATVKNNPAYGG